MYILPGKTIGRAELEGEGVCMEAPTTPVLNFDSFISGVYLTAAIRYIQGCWSFLPEEISLQVALTKLFFLQRT